jgi:hypothetical protein
MLSEDNRGNTRRESRGSRCPAAHSADGGDGNAEAQFLDYPRSAESIATTKKKEETMKATANKFPPGWDEARVQRVLKHYETQTDDEAVAEDEAAYESTTETTMGVPTDLVPKVRELIARRRTSKPRTKPDARRR